MELSNKAVKEICSCGLFRNLRRGEAIFCEEAKGKNAPSGLQFIDISSGEICVATEFFPTGHMGYDSCVDTEKMKTCPYKKTY